MQALEYPKYTLPDGVTYTLRLSLSAAMRSAEAKEETKANRAEQAWQLATVQAAAMAYVEKDGTLEYSGLKPEDILAMYGPDPDWWQFQELRDALDEAIRFRPPVGENKPSELAAQNAASQTNG